MVFCYKIITESPRRSGFVSPRKGSPDRRLIFNDSSISQLINTIDYETIDSGNLLDEIPERDWRLLSTLHRKREDEEERDRLAEQFRRLWEKEKIASQIVAEQSSEQYKRYLSEKREQERSQHAWRNWERRAAENMQEARLADWIKYKELESADRIAHVQDRKTTEILDKAMEEEARSYLAADRRLRRTATEKWKKELELLNALQRMDEAAKRRNAKLRDASQRTAISNVLTMWEANILREENRAMDEAKRAQFAAHAALTDLRSWHFARTRDLKKLKARQIANLTQQLRDTVRAGRLLPSLNL